MCKALTVLASLALPVAAFAQAGVGYHDKFGVPLVFAQVEIPIYDQNGRLLVDPKTQQPISASFCLAVPVDEELTDRTEQISTSDAHWLQAIHYTLDLPHRQIVIRHVWVLDTIKTPESPGYRVIHSPRMVNYDLEDYRAPLLDTRPLDGRCNWDEILANLVVSRKVAIAPFAPASNGSTCRTEFIDPSRGWQTPNGSSPAWSTRTICN